MTRHKTALGIGLAAGLATIVLAALLVPAWVDWRAFRPQVAAALSAIAGQSITLAEDGQLAVQLLPAPTLTVDGIGSGMGITVRQVRLRLDPLSLLAGQIDIDRLILDGLDMTVTVDAQGQWQWPFAADHARLRHMQWRDSTLRLHRPDGAVVSTGSALAGELDWPADGPVSVTAAARLNDAVPVAGTLTVTPPARDAEPWSVRLSLRHAEQPLQMDFSGIVAGDGTVQGAVTAQGQWPVLRQLWETATGTPADKAEADQGQSTFEIKAMLNRSAQGVTVDQINLAAGFAEGTGSLEFPADPNQPNQIILSLSRLELNGLAQLSPVSAVWPHAPANIDLLVDAIDWRGGTIRDTRLLGSLTLDGLRIESAQATLPGDTQVQVSGQIQRNTTLVDLAVQAQTDDLRRTLQWAGVPTEQAQPERLRKSGLQGRFQANWSDNTWRLYDTDLTLDSTRFQGEISQAGSSLTVAGKFDSLDVDAYWPISQGSPWLSRADIRFDVAMDQGVIGSLPVQQLRTIGTTQAGLLTLEQANIASLAGMSVQAKGRINLTSIGDNTDFALDVAAPTLLPVMRAMAVQPMLATDRLGAVHLNVQLQSAANIVQIAGNLDLDSDRVSVAGTVDWGVNNPLANLTVHARFADAARPLRLLVPDWRPAMVAALDLTATVNGTWQQPSLTDVRATIGGTSVIANGKLDFSDTGIISEATVTWAEHHHAAWSGRLIRQGASWSADGELRLSDITLPSIGLIALDGGKTELLLRGIWSDPYRFQGNGQLQASGGMLRGLDMARISAAMTKADQATNLRKILDTSLTGSTPVQQVTATIRTQQPGQQPEWQFDQLAITTEWGSVTGQGRVGGTDAAITTQIQSSQPADIPTFGLELTATGYQWRLETLKPWLAKRVRPTKEVVDDILQRLERQKADQNKE